MATVQIGLRIAVQIGLRIGADNLISF
jgi:hypothetical protein